jgi:hypothetical protein
VVIVLNSANGHLASFNDMPKRIVVRDGDGNEYLDWPSIGRDPYHVPKTIPTEAEVGSCMTLVTSLVAAYGDPPIDPRSGGIIGQQVIAAELLMSPRQARRTILGADCVRWVGDVPAIPRASLEAWVQAHIEQARAAHLAALGIVTNCSPGTNAK